MGNEPELSGQRKPDNSPALPELGKLYAGVYFHENEVYISSFRWNDRSKYGKYEYHKTFDRAACREWLRAHETDGLGSDEEGVLMIVAGDLNHKLFYFHPHRKAVDSLMASFVYALERGQIPDRNKYIERTLRADIYTSFHGGYDIGPDAWAILLAYATAMYFSRPRININF